MEWEYWPGGACAACLLPASMATSCLGTWLCACPACLYAHCWRAVTETALRFILWHSDSSCPWRRTEGGDWLSTFAAREQRAEIRDQGRVGHLHSGLCLDVKVTLYRGSSRVEIRIPLGLCQWCGNCLSVAGFGPGAGSGANYRATVLS